MFVFIALFLFFVGAALLITGIWILFFAKQIKVSSSLLEFLILGSVLTALIRTVREPNEYYLKDWAKTVFGIVFIVGALLVFYSITLVFSARLL